MRAELPCAGRRLLLAVAALLFVWSASIGADTPSVSRASDEQQITALIQSWEEAWNRHDMHAFANLFHDDGIWVLWTGQVWKGRTAIEEGHAAVHKTVFRNSVQNTRLADSTPD